MSVEKPIAYDLCCGSGGWAAGLIAAGFHVIGFDIDEQPLYPGEFRRRDVKTIEPGELMDGALIVASPPCEEFSRHHMPWTRARNPPPPDLSIVEYCRKLQERTRLPMVMENVQAAQTFIGKAKAHVGPYYLWGDIPKMLPLTARFRKKESYGSKNRLERARVPIELSTFVGKLFAPITCAFCGYMFDNRCGLFGCPNCMGEGL